MKENKTNCLTLFSSPTAAWFSQTFGEPTEVQKEAWPAIASGSPVLISAPTGTGKTLSAFLVFIDQLQALAAKGELKEELYLIYVSPLKSLAGDIRENLKKPLEGIQKTKDGEGVSRITVGMRTGDTPQKDRQRMVKHPPHILIITPESLYLMLTSRTGQAVLCTARALIIDELHALIDTKRGAHLMLSAARLDRLCPAPLQRIGLSATIEPLERAAEYLSCHPVQIVSPAMGKEVRIEVEGLTPSGGRRKDPVWEELGAKVYERCLQCRSVIAFSEGRRYAEKLAYYVNQLAGEGFARVHHGSMSKEQRMEAEEALREGKLRLLCATSSMELGIDVGDIDQVLQIGCPRTVSSTMQRLGRAGHNPGRTSVMYMYPRTAPETLYCGLTAQAAREGGVEQARPPKMCLDVLAQHLVSMAAVPQKAPGKGGGDGTAYTLDDVMDMLSTTYTFREVSRQDVKDLLEMLAGDYEHRQEIPVRPRILYDRLNERVYADAYSRMLAVAAGGTIPDKGLYTAKTEDGVKVGELDEEFVYESRLGDRFMLGAFGWKIVGQDKDTVIVTQTGTEGARLPFWKGEIAGRDLKTSLAFAKWMGKLSDAQKRGTLKAELKSLGMDEAAVEHTSGFLERQIKATGILPDDKTIVIEHFTDSNQCPQMMIHALFGRRIHAPLSLLLREAARNETGMNVGCVEEEEGILLYPYGEEALPEKLIFSIDPQKARQTLLAMLPETAVFGMTFRYNCARALMMGMRQNKRQPLWMQRLRSTEMLERLLPEKNHPLIRETKRECLEDQWDIDGMLEILNAVRSGQIAVREIHTELPSPMSLPMQWKVEADQMYEYSPKTPGIRQAVYDELKYMEQMKPSGESLKEVHQPNKLPESADELHTFLMIEGDASAEEILGLCRDRTDEKRQETLLGWIRELDRKGLAAYVEPGLWIAAEHREEYEKALICLEEDAGMHLLRRMLYFRGPRTGEEIAGRYLPGNQLVFGWLHKLLEKKEIVLENGIYYHAKLYTRAQKATIRNLRMEAATQPSWNYAAWMAERVRINDVPAGQLRQAVEELCGETFPVSAWEEIIFPRRVHGYSEGLLDKLLAEGDFFWEVSSKGLAFGRYEDVDWDAPKSPERLENLLPEEAAVYQELLKRGASFMKTLARLPLSGDIRSLLMGLLEKGLVCADSFVPVRQWQNREKMKKAAPRQRVNARLSAMSAGRWDILRPQKKASMEELLPVLLQENGILCRETFNRSMNLRKNLLSEDSLDWSQALQLLRIWEFTGQVRRGYFVKGLSGAQFIRRQDYEGMLQALKTPGLQLVWLNASDPRQIWGKVLVHMEGRAFLNVPGTAVALWGGIPILVLERQGKVLRVLAPQDDSEKKTEPAIYLEALKEFASLFQEKAIFPELRRLTVKEYPEKMKPVLKEAGFSREMLNFVLYR